MKHNMKCTANIFTIFIRVTDYVHPNRGKIAGHFCLVCRYVLFLKFNMIYNILPRDKGVRQVAQFFSGGTLTLHTHIARYEPFLSSNTTSSLTLSKK